MVHANEKARRRKLSDGAICLLSHRPWPYQDEGFLGFQYHNAAWWILLTKGVDQRRSLIYHCLRRVMVMEGRMQWVLASPHTVDAVYELPKEDRRGGVALSAQGDRIRKATFSSHHGRDPTVVTSARW
jgi:hypothetical protein